MAELITKILDANLKIFAFLTGFIGVLAAMIQGIHDRIVEISGDALYYLGEVVLCIDPVDLRGVGLDLEVMNTFIPLREVWCMLVSVLLLSSVVLGVRWVKSFIPTVSN